MRWVQRTGVVRQNSAHSLRREAERAPCTICSERTLGMGMWTASKGTLEVLQRDDSFPIGIGWINGSCLPCCSVVKRILYSKENHPNLGGFHG